MHAFSHTLAHRAPPASRTRARWQPYNSLSTYSAPTSSSSCSKSSSPVSDSTPGTSYISPCQPPLACDNSAIRTALQNPSATSTEPLRDPNSSKNKFALGLVDQAVKTLCEVWRPQDIPTAFSNPRTTRPAATIPSFSAKTHLSETSPLHRLAPKSHSTACITTASTSIPTSHTIPPANAAPALIQPGTSTELRNLVPIRGFVHEVLRRSRTSGCVLQTALCYLEAIRPKITELAQLERIGKGTNGEPESEPRIFKATEEEIERYRLEEEQELAMSDSAPTTIRFSDDTYESLDCMDTVRIETDDDAYLVAPDESSMTQNQASSLPMAVDSVSSIEETDPSLHSSATLTSPTLYSRPSGHLPSPLLCPRRAFLAALILASKFTQDKCYSNRAWAKLSGLPAKEIGRCERALGSALEWRLWVGKANSAASSTSLPSPPAHRAVVRCQSESSLNMTVSTPPEIMNPPPLASESSAATLETAIASVALIEPGRASGPRRTIKRASTLPSGAISSALNRFSRPGLCEIASPSYSNSGVQSESTSSTLVQPTLSFLPSVQLHVASPTPSSSSSGSALSSSPSPDLPGLSYSPSSVSSSPSSWCSTNTDRMLHISGCFEDAANSNEFFNSPVARINTKLLVPGFVSQPSAFGLHGFPMAPAIPKPSFLSPTPTYGPDGISPPSYLVDHSGDRPLRSQGTYQHQHFFQLNSQRSVLEADGAGLSNDSAFHVAS